MKVKLLHISPIDGIVKHLKKKFVNPIDAKWCFTDILISMINNGYYLFVFYL